MDTVTVTPNLTMLRVNCWQCYVWRDGDKCALIDTGSPGSGAEIAAAVPGLHRIVLTHGHVDHTGSAAELHGATGAPVLAGAGDASVIRGEASMPPPVLEEWERPILERVARYEEAVRRGRPPTVKGPSLSRASSLMTFQGHAYCGPHLMTWFAGSMR